MNSFKRIFALFIAGVTVVSLASCGKGDNAATTAPVTVEGATVAPMEIPDIDRGEEKINIAAPEDATGIAFLKLALDRGYAYNVEMSGVTSASAAEKLKNGEADIAVLSLEDISKLSSQADIRVLAVNSALKLSLIENGDAVTNVNDLKGKTIYCGLDDAASQAVAKAIFADNGMSVDLVFASAAEVETKMKNGEVQLCIFAEPDATRIASENEGFSKKADMTAAWKKDYAPVQSCVVAKADFVEANPDKIKEFLEHAEIGINYLTSEAGAGTVALQLAESGYFSTADIARDSINACGFVFADGEEMQAMVEGYCAFLADNGTEITLPQF